MRKGKRFFFFFFDFCHHCQGQNIARSRVSFGFSEDSILTSTSALEQQHRCRACFKDSPLCVARGERGRCAHESVRHDR